MSTNDEVERLRICAAMLKDRIDMGTSLQPYILTIRYGDIVWAQQKVFTPDAARACELRSDCLAAIGFLSSALQPQPPPQ